MPEQQWSIEQWRDIKHDFVDPVKGYFMRSIENDIAHLARFQQLTYEEILRNPESGSSLTELLRDIYTMLKNNLGRRPRGSAGRETPSGETPRSSTTRRRRRSIIGGSKRRMTRKQTTG
jgi:hypothetical protein